MSSVEYPGKLGEYLQGNNCYFIAALTDEYIVDRAENFGKYEIDSQKDKILEIRVFDLDKEYKLFRTSVGRPFIDRLLEDDPEMDHYDEVQYLDIDDSVRPADGKVRSTGGGEYNLPMDETKNAKVRIRYYLDKYSSTGQVRIKDWRVVGFEEG